MTPVFLPHTTLDDAGPLDGLFMSEAARKGRERLRQLRSLAIAEGAHVLLLVWPTLEWALLAVEVPPGVQIKDASQLIPNLMANPDALEKMQQNASQGEHLAWLQLSHPATALH